jgi:hypothetical protein
MIRCLDDTCGFVGEDDEFVTAADGAKECPDCNGYDVEGVPDDDVDDQRMRQEVNHFTGPYGLVYGAE